MKRTLKEVSRLTGFSPSTISRVLTKNRNVNRETRERVEAALSRLDYRPRRVNRKRLARKTILVTTNETASLFHVKAFDRMSARLRERGHIVLLGNNGFDEAIDEQYVEYAQTLNFSGIIMIAPVETPGLRKLVADSPCPIVLVNRYLRSVDLDTVYMDNYRAGYMAASHLVELGHRRLACIAGGAKSTVSVDRLMGFLDGLRDAGVARDACRVWEGDLKRASGRLFAEEFLAARDGVTAVFSVNESMMTGFVDTVLEGGLRIPGDVSVICLAPEPLIIKGDVKLTCIIHDAGLLGETAADMMLDRLDGLEVSPRKIVYPPRLCVQDSVGRIAGG